MRSLRTRKIIKKHHVTREQLARVIYRTMKIERHDMSRKLADELAKKIRFPTQA